MGSVVPHAHRRNLTSLLEESGDSGDSEPEDESGQTEIHEVELTAMQHRRRVVRNPDGQILTSYIRISQILSLRDKSNRDCRILVKLQMMLKLKEIALNLKVLEQTNKHFYKYYPQTLTHCSAQYSLIDMFNNHNIGQWLTGNHSRLEQQNLIFHPL